MILNMMILIMTNTLIRWRHLSKLIPMSRATVWRWQQLGKFPQSIKLTKRCVGWKREEIDNFIESTEYESFCLRRNIDHK